MILADCSSGIEKDELVTLYKPAVKQPFHFLKIDLETGDKNKKFSKIFTDFYHIENESERVATKREDKIRKEAQKEAKEAEKEAQEAENEAQEAEKETLQNQKFQFRKLKKDFFIFQNFK